MAIIIEEEKVKADYTSGIGWLVIIGILGFAAYYLVFAVPPPATVAPPAGFEDVTLITQIQADPSAIIQSKAFQALKQTVQEPTSTGPAPVGKNNPFVP